MTTEGNTNAGNVFVQDPALFDVLTWTGNNWVNYPSTSLIPGYATVSNTGFGLQIPDQLVGTNNVWLGYQAGGGSLTTANNNVIIGAAATPGSATCSQTVMIGSLTSNNTGNGQTIIGYNAQAANTGNQDVVIGAYAKLTGQAAAGSTNSTVLIGAGSQHQGLGQTVIVGANSGYLSNTDADNTYVGYAVGQKIAGSTTAIAGNTIVGSRSDGNVGLFPQCSRLSMFGAFNNVGTQVSNYTTICGASNNTLSTGVCILGANNSVASGCNNAVVCGNGNTVSEAQTLWLGGVSDTLKVQTACGIGTASALPGVPQGYLKCYVNQLGPYVIPFWPA